MIRFAILCAVSTKSQATLDKISLPDQEEKGRHAGTSRGWVETAGPYIIEGKSRTNWDDLHEAQEHIPELRQMLADAEQGIFDILILYDYNRLRDLLNSVAKVLIDYNVQIFSVNQPIEPLPPEDFHPYASDAEPMVRGLSQIISQWTISDMRRKYRIGVPARIDKGLNPLKPSFGYRWVGKKEPPAQDPAKCALIVEMKDLFFAGRGIYEICRHADASGIEPPMPTKRAKPGQPRKWDSTTVKYILRNPFYAGFVVFNKSVLVRDVRRKTKHRQVMQPRSKWKMAKGLHKPLWDEATYHAILREFERRSESTQHYAARFPFSGLLHCSECDNKLHRHQWGSVGYGRRRVLACATGTAHIAIDYEEGVILISNELERQFNERKAPSQDTSPAEPLPEIDPGETLIAEFKRKRRQVQEDRLAGIYSQAEAAELIASFEDQIARLEQKAEVTKESIRVQEEFQDLLGDKFEHLAEWILTDDPHVVHRILQVLCQKIIVHPNRQIEIHWRSKT